MLVDKLLSDAEKKDLLSEESLRLLGLYTLESKIKYYRTDIENHQAVVRYGERGLKCIKRKIQKEVEESVKKIN